MTLKNTVEAAHEKLKNTMDHAKVTPVLDKDGEHGGYTLEHHMHNYDHVENSKTYHMKNHNEVAKHLKDCKFCSPGMSVSPKAKDEEE